MLALAGGWLLFGGETGVLTAGDCLAGVIAWQEGIDFCQVEGPFLGLVSYCQKGND